MDMNATEFRKTLFRTLDQAIAGAPVSVTYKGERIRLVLATTGGSKLARAVRRDALVADPDSIVGPDPELMRSLKKKWSAEDKRL